MRALPPIFRRRRDLARVLLIGLPLSATLWYALARAAVALAGGR